MIHDEIWCDSLAGSDVPREPFPVGGACRCTNQQVLPELAANLSQLQSWTSGPFKLDHRPPGQVLVEPRPSMALEDMPPQKD